MLEKIVVRTENNSFIVGIGCVDSFTLTSALEWHALDEFINSKKGSYLFSAINYSLGFQIRILHQSKDYLHSPYSKFGKLKQFLKSILISTQHYFPEIIPKMN